MGLDGEVGKRQETELAKGVDIDPAESDPDPLANAVSECLGSSTDLVVVNVSGSEGVVEGVFDEGGVLTATVKGRWKRRARGKFVSVAPVETCHLKRRMVREGGMEPKENIVLQKTKKEGEGLVMSSVKCVGNCLAEAVQQPRRGP